MRNLPGGGLRSTWIEDDHGGVRIFRGTNVSSDAKWRENRLTSLDGSDFERLHVEFGMSAVRILAFWEAIEPQRGSWNEAYLSGLRRCIEDAASAGLDVILDMHQDLFGCAFHSAGFPRWCAADELARDYHPQVPWFWNYFNPNVRKAFDGFWQSESLQRDFAAAWGKLVQTVDDIKRVRVLEIVNEPFWGSAGRRDFEQRILPSFYERVIDAIRRVDTQKRHIALAPSLHTNIGWRTRLAWPSDPRLLFAPHVYPAAVELGIGDLGSPHRRVKKLANMTKAPTLVTEFGVRRSVLGSSRYIRKTLDAFDKAMLGAMHWEAAKGSRYGLWNDKGVVSSLGRALLRPHPTRIAGTPERWSWNGEVFAFDWTEHTDARGMTVILVPTRLGDIHAPDLDVTISDGTYEVSPPYLRIPRTGERRSLRMTVRDVARAR